MAATISQTPHDRSGLADELRGFKPLVSRAVADQYGARHPGLAPRPAAIETGDEVDGHLDFLVGALQAGETSAFADYVRWTCRVRTARGHDVAVVDETLDLMAGVLESLLDAPRFAAVQPFLAAGRAACTPSAPPSAPPAPADDAVTLSRNLFLQAILGGHRKAAVSVVLEAVAGGFSPDDVYVEIFQEALYEVGRRWECNEITVAEEHMATAIAQHALGQVYEHMDPPEGRVQGRIVIAGVQGELHQIGANIVADALAAAGWDVRFLGSNCPTDGIVEAVRAHRADIFGLSVTMLFNLPHAQKVIEALRGALGDAVPRIIVGGAAFRCAPEAWRDIGADGVFQDVRALLQSPLASSGRA